MRILIANAVKWGAEHACVNFPKDVSEWISSTAGGGAGEFVPWLAQEGPPPEGEFAAVIVSGSASSAYDSDEWIARLKDAIRAWAEESIPMLGICFGHQVIADALGGRVVKNPLGWEVGTRTVELTEAGMRDPILKGAPAKLRVMESHQDVVAEPPPGAVVLARNEMSACQALAIGDSIRTVQFHPEYTVERIAFLLGPRREMLAGCGVNFDATLKGLEPTREAPLILKNFLAEFVLPRAAAGAAQRA